MTCFLKLTTNVCLVCANFNSSVFRWPCKAVLSHFYISCSYRSCWSSPRGERAFHGVVRGRPRSWPPWRAKWNECSSSCCRSERRRTRTLQSMQIRCPEAGTTPSGATAEGSIDAVSLLDKPATQVNRTGHISTLLIVTWKCTVLL